MIDDNPADQQLVKAAVRGNTLDVELSFFLRAEDALDALQAGAPAWNPSPDLVLLDINLPGKTGFAVLEVLRSTSKCEDVRVVMFTSSKRSQDVMRAESLGADGYVQKPTTLGEFFNAVIGAIRGDTGAFVAAKQSATLNHLEALPSW